MRTVPAAFGEMVAGVSLATLFHEVIEAAAIGMVMLDLEGRIRYANTAYCDMFGYAAEEILHCSFVSLTHPDDREATSAALAALQRGEEESLRVEIRSLSKGGAVLWVHVRASLLRGQAGAAHAIMGVVEDVTRQRVIEEARRELWREREALLDSAAEGIYGVDLRGRCTFVNRAAAEMLGYTREEMLGRNMHALVHGKYPDGRPYPAEECRIVQAVNNPANGAGGLRNCEETLWRKDGSPVVVEHSAELVVLDGEVRGTVVTLRDVSGRDERSKERQALLQQDKLLRQRAEVLSGALQTKERALREALDEQLQLMEAIPQMVWVTGPAGEPEYVNERWRIFTQTEPKVPFGGLDLIHSEDRERTADVFEKALRTKEPYEVEHRMRHADGGYRWVLARAHPLLDAEGEVAHWFGTSTDIHERRLAEDLLRRTEKLAAAGRLAATVAHEINNPLEAVGNLLYLALHENGLPVGASHYLQMANEELRRVGHIVSQTLGFYRESSTPQPIDLSTLVNDVVALYQRKLDARQIRVTRNMQSNVTVNGIPGELRQVVANLLSNALDAMEPYGILSMEVRLQKKEARVSISDTGHGIATPLLEHIFEPFFTTKKDAGTGLGLWVSKGIVEKHHGRLEVSSSREEGSHGTAFLLTLPLLDAKPREVEAAQA